MQHPPILPVVYPLPHQQYQSNQPAIPPEYLDQIFVRYGKFQKKVKEDVYNVLQHYPFFLPKESTFVTDDGQSHLMLLLDGTVPMSFQGAIYHIPINIWIGISYPLRPPLCYVVPTSDMVVKSKHRHVDPAGLCYHPYLSQWKPESSNLVGLVYALSTTFGEDPPVFAKPPDIPQFSIPSNPIIQPLVQPIAVQPLPISIQQPMPLQIQQPFPTQSQHDQQPQSPVNNIDNSSDNSGTIQSLSSLKYDKQKAVAAVTEKIRSRLIPSNKDYTKDMDRYFQTHQELEKSGQYLDNAIKSFEEEQQTTESKIFIIDNKMEELLQWLEQNENSTPSIDEVVVAEDKLSNQLFDLVAEDGAIEDALYYLNLALYKNRIDLEIYLKEFRSLSRSQMLARATSKKVLEQQMKIAGKNGYQAV